VNLLSLFSGRSFWFVNCIMCYYLLFYPIVRYVRHLKLLFCLTFVAVLAIWFVAYDFTDNPLLFYGVDTYRRYYFFLFMLQGAIIGATHDKYQFRRWHIAALIFSILLWYGILYLTIKTNWQILSIIPLLAITHFAFTSCNNSWFKALYHRKYIGKIIYSVAALCLDVYVIQFLFITDLLNAIFPLNIPCIMITIIIAAYLLHIASEFIRQTFDKAPYNWIDMIKL
jgi:hypothetical protein